MLRLRHRRSSHCTHCICPNQGMRGPDHRCILQSARPKSELDGGFTGKFAPIAPVARRKAPLNASAPPRWSHLVYRSPADLLTVGRVVGWP